MQCLLSISRCCDSGNVLEQIGHKCTNLTSGQSSKTSKFVCNNGEFKSEKLHFNQGHYNLTAHENGIVSLQYETIDMALPNNGGKDKNGTVRIHEFDLNMNSTHYCVCIPG